MARDGAADGFGDAAGQGLGNRLEGRVEDRRFSWTYAKNTSARRHECAALHSTVTDFARLRGLSTSVPRTTRRVIRQQLQRDRVHDRRDDRRVRRHLDDVHALAAARCARPRRPSRRARRRGRALPAGSTSASRAARRAARSRSPACALSTSASGPCFSSPAGYASAWMYEISLSFSAPSIAIG